jgi:hypothetical protein
MADRPIAIRLPRQKMRTDVRDSDIGVGDLQGLARPSGTAST